MQIHPLASYVVVRRLKVDDPLTRVVIANAPTHKRDQGEIIAVGNTVLNVKVGDKVLFEQAHGIDTRVGDKEFVVLKEENLMGILL